MGFVQVVLYLTLPLYRTLEVGLDNHVYALDDDDVTITYHFIDADGNEFLTDVLDDNERQSLKKVEGTERHYND